MNHEPRHQIRPCVLWYLCAGILWVIGLLAVGSLKASDVNLAWDASPTPGVTNYVLYASTNSLSQTNLASALVRLNVGTNLTATIQDLQVGQWSFAATAMKDAIESVPVVLNVEVPKAPDRMRTIVVQYGMTLTNFYDVGFFRLRLP